MADVNGNIQVDGLVKQCKELDALMASNPAMEKELQAVIRKVLSQNAGS